MSKSVCGHKSACLSLHVYVLSLFLPFAGGSHPSDVRITTRYSRANWIEGMAGTIHECGHAMYEQGRAPSHVDLPVSEALGMAVHESQSLLWERMVGQSRAFWVWATPIVHRYFPHTKECSVEDFYRTVNVVKPSLIRVDADEVTYPLHVIVRYELERAIFDGSIALSDLPKVCKRVSVACAGCSPLNCAA
jgi:carboxypeptidase Taq